MTVWVLKGGRAGEFEQRMLDHSVVTLGWSEISDLSGRDREALELCYRQVYPDAPNGRVANHVGQLFAFADAPKTGDLVVVPLKTRAAIAIGEIASDYCYRTDFGADMPHTRSVRWLKTDIPRTRFDQDVLYTFGSSMTFSRAERNNAEQRIRRIVDTPASAGLRSTPAPVREPPAEAPEEQDIEQHARDRIVGYVGRRFRGHELARLVDAILRAQGFVTRRSDPGPDGGADIVAGSGPMGYGAPRLCVQVKSSDSPADVTVYRGLKGTMQSFGAEQGLLVSWGGFKDTVRREAQTDFFRVRLWDSEDLLDAILANYEHLGEETQATLPLKRIWTVALLESDD